MQLNLTQNETRVIGSMIEKAVTTPDQYPLSLNALTNACNQKSNRDPVMALAETEVQTTLDDLAKKRLIMEKSGFGSRVPKYQHRFAGTEFGEFRFDDRELAVVCVLFLRGPQTPGELRSRTQRLCRFNDMGEVEAVLSGLTQREDGPYVAMLPREPGRRESRYAHLFSGEVEAAAPAPPQPAPPMNPYEEDHIRLAVLEQRVDDLAKEVEALKRAVREGALE